MVVDDLEIRARLLLLQLTASTGLSTTVLASVATLTVFQGCWVAL